MAVVPSPPEARIRPPATLRNLGVRHVWPLWLAVALLMAKAVSTLGAAKVGMDAHAYWLTAHHSSLYWRAPAQVDAYLYSPAFAQLIRPFALLPWPVFYGTWVVAESLAFAWLLKPLGWAWGVPAYMLCAFEIIPGNVTAFIAAAAVIGTVRTPSAWCFVLVTKPTLALGLARYAGRREWRVLRNVVALAAAVACLSALLWPTAWPEWVRFLMSHRGQDPTLPYRAGLAWLLAFATGRRGPRWCLLPLMVLASPPTLAIGEYMTLFAALPRMLKQGSPE